MMINEGRDSINFNHLLRANSRPENTANGFHKKILLMEHHAAVLVEFGHESVVIYQVGMMHIDS